MAAKGAGGGGNVTKFGYCVLHPHQCGGTYIPESKVEKKSGNSIWGILEFGTEVGKVVNEIAKESPIKISKNLNVKIEFTSIIPSGYGVDQDLT